MEYMRANDFRATKKLMALDQIRRLLLCERVCHLNRGPFSPPSFSLLVVAYEAPINPELNCEQDVVCAEPFRWKLLSGVGVTAHDYSIRIYKNKRLVLYFTVNNTLRVHQPSTID